MVAGIIKDGQVIWTKGYGYADIQKNIPVTNSTIFHLASLTKTFASTVIMQLVKENKISLEAPVADYGINLAERGTVRVVHLFNTYLRRRTGQQF
jgi:CubicO group peptidase (beta-lactamase class C family)